MSDKKNVGNEKPTLQCTIPVHMVDTMAGLEDALRNITTPGRIVGMDTEWYVTALLLLTMSQHSYY